MKKLVWFLCTFFFQLTQAQEHFIPLYPEGIPCENQLEMEVEVRDDIGRIIRKVHTPEMAVYHPTDEVHNGSAVLICPGGGYTVLAWDWEGTTMAEWFNEMGITAFVLRYRLPHWESEACHDKVALMDAQRAMRTIRMRADEFKINPEKVGVMGFSAGGHLASSLSTHFDGGKQDHDLEVKHFSCRPDFSILMYPVITMDTTVAHSGSRKNLIGTEPEDEMVNYYSNEKQITSETPPTLLIHATDDEGVVPDNSIIYYQALRKHGVPAALHIYESGAHGFSFAEGKGSVSEWPQLCQTWLSNLGM